MDENAFTEELLAYQKEIDLAANDKIIRAVNYLGVFFLPLVYYLFHHFFKNSQNFLRFSKIFQLTPFRRTCKSRPVVKRCIQWNSIVSKSLHYTKYQLQP